MHGKSVHATKRNVRIIHVGLLVFNSPLLHHTTGRNPSKVIIYFFTVKTAYSCYNSGAFNSYSVKKGVRAMEQKDNGKSQSKSVLRAVLAAELFSKLPEDKQDFILNQLKALLSR
jgi:hypothetical protein